MSVPGFVVRVLVSTVPVLAIVVRVWTSYDEIFPMATTAVSATVARCCSCCISSRVCHLSSLCNPNNRWL